MPVTPMAADATAQQEPPVHPLTALLAQVQAALRNGYTREEISAALERDKGITLDRLESTTRVTPKNVLNMVAQGSTLGAADEIIARMRNLSSERAPYRETRDAIRERNDIFREAHPVVATGSEVAGGLLGAGLPAAGTVRTAPGLLRAAGRGAAVGGVTGAVAGAGYAPEMSDVPGGMVRGGVGGGLLGAFLSGGGEGLLQLRRGRSGTRLQNAIDAGGGESALRRAAGEAVEAGRGRVNPVGSLSPYLRGEAEFAATRSPAVFGKYGPRTAQARSGDAERLIRDVSDITGTPSVIGREALVAQRAQQFGPVYEALAATAKPLEGEHAQRFLGILNRPYVKRAYQEAVDEGLLQGVAEGQPGFRALNNLRQHMRSAQEKAFSADDGARGAAFRQAADDLESLLEDAVPEFRAVQSAYRDASRPVNIIDLARLETSRQGRASPALDQASRELRSDLLNAFGSGEKYRAFMQRVAKEGELAQFNAQVFGNSATGRRLLQDQGVQAEDLVGAVTQPSGIPSRVGRFLTDATGVTERAARDMAPMLFAPSSAIDDVIRQLRALQRKQSGGPFTRGVLPLAGGLLSGQMAQ